MEILHRLGCFLKPCNYCDRVATSTGFHAGFLPTVPPTAMANFQGMIQVVSLFRIPNSDEPSQHVTACIEQGLPGQIIVTSKDLTPKCSVLEGKSRLFQGILCWWNTIIWPDVWKTTSSPHDGWKTFGRRSWIFLSTKRGWLSFVCCFAKSWTSH